MKIRNATRLATVVALLAALAACGTTPTPVADTRPAPAERVFAFATQPAGEYGTLVVTRDRGLSGSAAGIDLIINGTRAATLRQGERVTLYVPAGEEITVTAQVLRQTQTVETTFKPGQTRTYRMSFDPVNNLNFGAANLVTQ
jgi:hypothetical protein